MIHRFFLMIMMLLKKKKIKKEDEINDNHSNNNSINNIDFNIINDQMIIKKTLKNENETEESAQSKITSDIDRQNY